MYQALLTKKYLTSKLMPILAMVAVMLSVATILITWSVMGGFLKTLVNSGRSLIGDVTVSWPNVGFAHYDELITMLEEDDLIDGATPIIETFGLVQLPDDRIELITIKGIDPTSYPKVTNFSDTIWWKPIEKPTAKDHDGTDVRLDPQFTGAMAMFESNAMTLTRTNPESGITEPAGVLGVEVTGLNIRTASGIYEPNANALRALPNGGIERVPGFMPAGGTVGMTVLSLDSTGKPVDPVTRTIPIANEFQSGIYEIDNASMFVPLSVMQEMLRLDEAKKVEVVENPFATERDPATGKLRPKRTEVVGIDPARVTTVLVRAADGADLGEVRDRVFAVYQAFEARHVGEVPSPFSMENQIRTWEEMNATMISAVKKETGLVLFIFGIVSFTSVFLVLAIFWSMVSEKTKDIGILRALGASTPGVAWLWIRYGTAIGLIGAILGTVAGYLVVVNINAIHDWLGRDVGGFLSNVFTTISGWFGGNPVVVDLTIWNPQTYYFIEIPHEVDLTKAVIVFVVGVLTCVLGSLIPAFHSARMDPVKALRFE